VNSIRNVVRVVAIANLSYFFVEFFFAVRIGSVSLFADSIDFLEDASVNILIFLASAFSVLITTLYEINNPSTPDAISLTAVGFGALIVNFSCAFILAKFRQSQKSLVMAAYLSARNDALANVAIISAGITTIFWDSSIPDLAVGLAIGMLNANAAIKVWKSTDH